MWDTILGATIMLVGYLFGYGCGAAKKERVQQEAE